MLTARFAGSMGVGPLRRSGTHGTGSRFCRRNGQFGQVRGDGASLRTAVVVLLAALVALATPSPAGAVPSYRKPMSAEWWFTAWQIETKVWPINQGEGVTIGVIDSGVQANVPDLVGATL